MTKIFTNLINLAHIHSYFHFTARFNYSLSIYTLQYYYTYIYYSIDQCFDESVAHRDTVLCYDHRELGFSAATLARQIRQRCLHSQLWQQLLK